MVERCDNSLIVKAVKGIIRDHNKGNSRRIVQPPRIAMAIIRGENVTFISEERPPSGETFVCLADVYLTFDMVPLKPPYEDATHPIEEAFLPRKSTIRDFRKIGVEVDKVCRHCHDCGL